jgi:hypothetical protein
MKLGGSWSIRQLLARQGHAWISNTDNEEEEEEEEEEEKLEQEEEADGSIFNNRGNKLATNIFVTAAQNAIQKQGLCSSPYRRFIASSYLQTLATLLIKLK